MNLYPNTYKQIQKTAKIDLRLVENLFSTNSGMVYNPFSINMGKKYFPTMIKGYFQRYIKNSKEKKNNFNFFS